MGQWKIKEKFNFKFGSIQILKSGSGSDHTMKTGFDHMLKTGSRCDQTPGSGTQESYFKNTLKCLRSLVNKQGDLQWKISLKKPD